MALDTLIIRVRPGETRIARTNGDGVLKDFAIYRGQTTGLVGDVFLGRVKKVVPTLEAAFVDLGLERDGFLALAEARPQQHTGGETLRDRISDYVHEGQAVMVQITAAARDDKGPKLMRRISVPGNLMVLTPGDPGIRVSKRINDNAERGRLRALLSGHLSGKDGCVIRSAARGVRDKAVQAEIALLHARWEELEENAADATAPALLSGDVPPAVQFLMENGHGGLARIVADDPETAVHVEAELDKLGALPKDGIERHPGGTDVFETLGVADAVESLLSPVVDLPGGGSLVIEETAALTAIDVNAGRSIKGGRSGDLALATNLEAMVEAARQMRLRNLAGLIVIDYLSMSGKDGPGRVVTALKEAVSADPAGPQVLGTTKGGLLEITRPRRRPPLSSQLLASCPVCGSTRAEAPLSVGYRALDRVLAEVWAQPSLIPALRASSAVVLVLKDQGAGALAEVADKLGQPLELIADDTMVHGQFQIEPSERP